MLIRLSALLALAIAAASPASAAEIPSKLNADQLASIKSIGVVSAVGDTLNIGTNGPFLRFSVTQKSRPISDMRIDDALEMFVGQKLNGRFKIEKVQYDRTKFSSVQEPGFLQATSLPPTQELIKDLTASVDAYLVISKDLVPFGLDDKVLRPGLNIGRGGFHEDQYVADAFISLSLFDARTDALLAKSVYPPPISHFWGGQVQRLPLDGALWPDDSGNFTQVQHDELRKVFIDDLSVIVDKIMGQMGLNSSSSP